MNLIPTAVTAWRNERSIEDAIRQHDQIALAKDITIAATFLFTCLRGTKYAQLASFADPDLLTGVGLVFAFVISRFGHWSIAGHLDAAAGAASMGTAAVARSPGDAVASGDAHAAAPVGSRAANTGASSALRPLGDPSAPEEPYLRG